ncbi:MAG: hypothetical protein GKS00_18375 [Alphaproteobacteria bacterium]|nr:hypothetical protein [Alphaproteobacteria bacterium]
MANAIEKIQEEHKDYGRVLNALRAGVKTLRGIEWRRQAGQTPEAGADYRATLDLLFSAVYYVRLFPDKYHHPKEEDFLFKAIRERRPDSADLLDQLALQHSVGARLIDELDASLKAYEKTHPDGLEALEAATENFVTSQFDHMSLEEEKVIPLAKSVLTEADWHTIDNAFLGNADPLFGENLEAGFRMLHDHIVKGLNAA